MAFAAIASIGGNACAMSPGTKEQHRCRVIDGDKLPAASGGSNALCAAVEQAIRARSPGMDFSAVITVHSPNRLSASIARGGERLPEQKFASVDRQLGRDSFKRFAAAIADQLAKGQK